ncbi:hypothetical protein EVAR_24657_1 [Eumeta japonica]|uniref:Uncharacterized protein n=1 Tax=Eumeta variegata TaxID=151549 RepID=A0A4C1V152_EUMVA|nr:hypothetical protein EVAR_24657_1 [Eumeta japonica]
MRDHRAIQKTDIKRPELSRCAVAASEAAMDPSTLNKIVINLKTIQDDPVDEDDLETYIGWRRCTGAAGGGSSGRDVKSLPSNDGASVTHKLAAVTFDEAPSRQIVKSEIMFDGPRAIGSVGFYWARLFRHRLPGRRTRRPYRRIVGNTRGGVDTSAGKAATLFMIVKTHVSMRFAAQLKKKTFESKT